NSASLPVVSLPLARVIGPRSSKSPAGASPPPPPPESDPPPQSASATAAVVTPPAARTGRRDANGREVLSTMSKLLCSDASSDVLDHLSVRAHRRCRGPDTASTPPPPHSTSPADPPSAAPVSARPIDCTHERHRRPPRRCRASARPPGVHRCGPDGSIGPRSATGAPRDVAEPPFALPASTVPDPSTAPGLRWGVIAPGHIAGQATATAHRATASRVVSVVSRWAQRAEE